jgi:hypothetical protein
MVTREPWVAPTGSAERERDRVAAVA